MVETFIKIMREKVDWFKRDIEYPLMNLKVDLFEFVLELFSKFFYKFFPVDVTLILLTPV